MNIDHIAIHYRRILDLELNNLVPVKTEGLEGQRSKIATVLMQDLFFEILKLSNSDGFLEIGALAAEASRRFRNECSKNSSVWAAEGHPKTHSEMLIKFDFKSMDINYIHSAIGSDQESATMFAPLLDENQEGRSMTSLKRNVNERIQVNQYQVPSMTLFDLYLMSDPMGENNLIGLWIDTEGASLEVLKSGINMLDKVAAIYVEVEDNKIWKHATSSLEIISLLIDQNFIPVARDHEHPFVWNLLAVRKDLYIDNLHTISKRLEERRQAILGFQE